jgi:hypothetical protein
MLSIWMFVLLSLLHDCQGFTVLQQRPRSSNSSPSTSAVSYASSATVPLSDKSFESRMKDLVLGTKSKTPAIQKDPSKPKNIVEVTTAEEYEQIVLGETEKLVVVRYYAPWCRVSVVECFMECSSSFSVFECSLFCWNLLITHTHTHTN